MTTYTNAEKKWTEVIQSSTLTYPCEYVIRIFKGKYPKLDLTDKLKNRKICDIGCGDGRNIPLLLSCGLKVSATEINLDIVNKVKSNLHMIEKNKYTVKVGLNNDLPYKNGCFDFLLSWNVCYYMGNQMDFQKHVKEYSRILKRNGILVMSIPKKSCFIYKGSKKITGGFSIIKNDPFKIRNGEILKIFQNEKDIEKEFSTNFCNFTFASIHDDCFGFEYHWHLVICHKK